MGQEVAVFRQTAANFRRVQIVVAVSRKRYELNDGQLKMESVYITSMHLRAEMGFLSTSHGLWWSAINSPSGVRGEGFPLLSALRIE